MLAAQISGLETPVEWNNEADRRPDPSVDEYPALFSQWSPQSLEGASRSPRTRHSRKSADGHIPRPPNAFILFRSSFIRSQRVSSEVETSHSTLSKIIGLTWQNLSTDERRVWHDRARDAMIEHRRRFPAYAFRPANRRGRGSISDADSTPATPAPKRKVREHAVVDDPVRCEKIAALLAEGKQGRELEAAMQEFDRQRGPSVVPARFEPPITATTYRRSSSAPAPDTETPAAFLRKAEPVVGQRRRSSSSGPPVCRSSQDDKDTTPQPETPSQTSCFSPWMAAPEPVYFDFSGFSFIPANPPLPQLTYDPLWSHDQQAYTTDFIASPEFTSGLDISAFQWAQTGGFDLDAYPDPSFAAPPMGTYVSQPDYSLEL